MCPKLGTCLLAQIQVFHHYVLLRLDRNICTMQDRLTLAMISQILHSGSIL